MCDSLNVQRTTQWPPTRAGETGHLGPFSHLYGPSVNILSEGPITYRLTDIPKH